MLTMTIALLTLAAPDTHYGRQPSLDRCGKTADKTSGTKLQLLHPLGEEPPASQILPVLRYGKDGCPAPVVLRKEIGANPEKARDLSGPHRMYPAH